MEQHEYSHFVRFPAAEACVSYISGTFHNDRFLPCDAEFGLVYGNPGKKGEGNFKAEDYRSSTEDTTEDNTTGMRTELSYTTLRSGAALVRPVRVPRRGGSGGCGLSAGSFPYPGIPCVIPYTAFEDSAPGNKGHHDNKLEKTRKKCCKKNSTTGILLRD